MKVTAVDIAILVPEPVRSLAIKLSQQVNPPEFCLNEVDILPHITLGIGFLRKFSIYNLQFTISNITKNIQPFEVVVERIEGRYLMCKKSDQLFKLHKAICDAVDFVKTEDFARAYVEETDGSTKDYTNNFKWRNAYENYVPHITVGWEDVNKSKVKVDSEKWKSDLPVKFTVNEISICQLGNKNTCRKVLARLPLGGR